MSAQQQDPKNVFQQLRNELQLVIEEKQASMMQDIRKGRNSRDDGLISRGRGGRLLGPDREDRNSRNDGLVSRGRAESDSGASAASGTDQGNGDDPPAVLSGRATHELSSWGRLPQTVRGRTRSQRQHLEDESTQRLLMIQREVEDALYAAVQEWTESGSMLESTSWTTEDAMAMMAGGPAAEENKGELSVCMPSGFPEDVEPSSQSVADEKRSKIQSGVA